MADSRPTNFFARQADARKSSHNLIVLFFLTVLLIAFIVSVALRIIWFIFVTTQAFMPYSGSQYYYNKLYTIPLFDPVSFFLVALAVILFILTASLIKTKQLQKGGPEIVQMLGGRLIITHSTDPAEKQLTNIVEEMAIASGIPVPLVFVLDNEKSINAFAAGLTLHDASIAVTSGALEQLSRDELQGVIAHEFSHILNGDMRLNIKLIGILYGILVIGILGGEIFEHRNITAIGGIVLITAGLLLGIIGYIGTFMGRLIQSAVSRQKEILADASAVQFTRNPMGLASALKKIGGYINGSRINSAKARQARHLFFGESHPDELFPFLNTHPPLVERIRFLDPSFDGNFVKMRDDIPPPSALPQYRSAYRALNIPPASSPLATIPAGIINLIGNPTRDNLDQSLDILTHIPDQIKQALNTPAGAAEVIYALLIGNDCRERELQLNAIHRSLVGNGNAEKALRLCDLINDLKDDQRLPLIELAMPQLRSLTTMEKRKFLEIINSLITADSKITLFEFALQWIVQQYLIPRNEEIFEKTTFLNVFQVGYQILIILRALANAGNMGNADAARLAFNTGVERIPELACKNPDYYYTENINFAEINTALKKLVNSSFKIKQMIIDACAHCAFADKTITIAEVELLRAVSLAIHCPLPPFMLDKSSNTN